MKRNKQKNNLINLIKTFFNNGFSKVNQNYYLLISIILLSIFGLFVLLSASSYLTIRFDHGRYYYVLRQGIAFVAGFFAMFIFSKVDYRIYYKKANIIYIIAIFLLVCSFIPGLSVKINGARRTVDFKLFSFMPSDFAKPAAIIMLAKTLVTNSRKKLKFDWKGGFFIPMLFIALPFALIFLQPDLSTSVVVLATLLAVYFVEGMNKKFLPTFMILSVIGIFLAYKLMKPYQLDRLTSFLNPEAHSNDEAWQVLHGLYAVSRGEITGVGYGKSIFKHGYLANEVSNDMIFSVIAEEFGFIGSVLFIMLVFTITYLIIKEAIKAREKFPKLLAYGIGILYFLQSMINIGVSLSIVPNTGITLPFVSSGLTSVISFCVMFGIVLNISRKNNYDEKQEKILQKKKNREY